MKLIYIILIVFNLILSVVLIGTFLFILKCPEDISECEVEYDKKS